MAGKASNAAEIQIRVVVVVQCTRHKKMVHLWQIYYNSPFFCASLAPFVHPLLKMTPPPLPPTNSLQGLIARLMITVRARPVNVARFTRRVAPVTLP